MKPSPFTYHAPQTLDEALDLLATLDNARVLAGGQSLMPMMNYRVVQPEHLIDLGRIAELAFIDDTPEGLKIGAMTTQRTIERSALVRITLPAADRCLVSRRPSADAQPRHHRWQHLSSRSVGGTAYHGLRARCGHDCRRARPVGGKFRSQIFRRAI